MKLRIVFMGTPEFAAHILKVILKHGHEVAAVITAPDKPAGRGQKIRNSAVKEVALANNLKIMQPVNLKDDDFLAELKSLAANLNIVVAFRMLPRAVWEMPELGTFNLHASILPDYRGAAPINWAIINGEKETGVTTFFIDDKIDTGELILTMKAGIEPDENAGRLHDRLMGLGGSAVLTTVKKIGDRTLQTQKQPDRPNLKPAPKLTRENTKIDWKKPVAEIQDLIRGLSPYPAAWFTLRNGGEEFSVKIFQSDIVYGRETSHPGSIIRDTGNLFIAGADGWIMIVSLQFPGKSKMSAKEFMNGFRIYDDILAL